MNAITNFDFEEMLVRVVEREGQPWFVLNDVAKVLDLKNPWNAAARLDDDEKGLHTMETLGGNQDQTIINESGLYALILTSRKPEAKIFRKWVTSEVLPAIRKTGTYGIALEPEPEEVPFFDPGVVNAPLGARVAAVAQVRRRWGRDAEAVAMRLYRLGDFTRIANSARAVRGNACLTHLLSSRIDDGLTVLDHIQVALSADDSKHTPLLANGMRAMVGPPSGLAVATSSDLVKAIFSGTEWAGGRHSAALRSLDGASAEQNMRFGDDQSRVIFLPLGLLKPI